MRDTPAPAVRFGAQLRRLRIAAGLSLTELGRRVYFSKGYISKVERGQKSASLGFARLCDAALAADGRLIALALEVNASPPAELSAEQHKRRASPEFYVDESTQAPAAADPTDGATAEHSLEAFRTLLASLRDLGQTLSPSSVMEMLKPHTDALRELARHTEPAQAREALLLAARFAECTGWMAQETGDDVAALRWTDRAVELARAAGDDDMIAYAFVRRANIALYQQDAYGTISFARQAQTMNCGARVHGLAAQREAQGHALAGDYAAFRRCIERSAQLLTADDDENPGRPILGPTKIPDTVALAEGWSLHDLGRSAEAVEILSRLFDRTPKRASRAWARIGARLALALASIREIDRACAVIQPILVISPVIESATIRSDLRQLSRILNRWSANSSVQRIMPDLSAALTPTATPGM